MRKTVVFILGVGLLVAALAAAGCKPRDAKKLALMFAPPPKCEVTASYTLGWDEEVYPEGEITGPGKFHDCEGMSGPQNVYEVVVPVDGYISYSFETSGPVVVSFRDNCDPNASCFTGIGGKTQSPDSIDDDGDSIGYCDCRYSYEDYVSGYCIYVPAGTYYIVVDSMGAGVEFGGWVYFGNCAF